MESINNFNKGMDSDTNPLNIEKGKYIEASNVRIINDINGTSHSVNNIKGNEFNITIPDTFVVQQIFVDRTIIGSIFITFFISGAPITTAGSFDVTASSTAEDLYNFLINDTNILPFIGVDFDIYFNSLYVLLNPLTSGSVIISIIGGLIIDDNFIPAQTDLEIIGSVNIREDIYLFTTNNTTKNPGGHTVSLAVDPSSVGQIWKYEYDKITLAGTLILIYNNYVDFTTYNAITPTAATGRYENSGIQRVYWTDFYNKLRSLNVANPQAFALELSILDVTPAVDMDRPIMTDIGLSSSSIKVGVYQSAYRLKNTGGATTNFSELSDLVYVVPSYDEHNAVGGAEFKDYVGGNAGSGAGKQITWTISNLDTDFDRIEIAIIFKANLNDVPTIFIVEDEPVSGETHTVIYDGTQDEIPLTLSEFLALSSVFTHCKTIGTKDNRLFVGNIRNQYSEIDYDARAFRAFSPGADDVLLTNNGLDDTAITQAAASASSETSDSINKYSDLARACFYKPGTTILGGAGINISYEFYTEALPCDRDTQGSNEFNIPDYIYAPWRSNNSDYNQTSLDLGVDSFSDNFTQVSQTIPTAFPNPINAGFKYLPYSSALRGFQRTEVYRFGIQFFDKSKNPTFVKWIGDIKMPDFYDFNPNAFYSNGDAVPATIMQDFRLSFIDNHVPSDSYYEAYVQTLGIKFTVNIPSDISEQIDGYSIVRVKREEKDKTIVSQGYIHPALVETDGNVYTTSPSFIASGNGPVSSTVKSKGFFITPDINDNSLTHPNTSMNMKLKAILVKANSKTSNWPRGSGGVVDPYYMFKHYHCLKPNTTTVIYSIEQMELMGYAGNTSDSSSSGMQVFNYDAVPGNEAYGYSIGNPAYYFRTPLPGINYTIMFNADDKLLMNMERDVPYQYGGATYSDRSKNEYISCSHYRPIRNVASAISDTFNLFGGDIFVNMYDSCRWAKNWGTTGRGVDPFGFKYSTTFFFPVESMVNTELRHGIYMNKDFSSSYESSSTAAELKENNVYNPIYSAQCNAKLYYPKPDPFILNEEFDNRFYNSEIKINGEHTDNWGVFKVNNYWDVEGTYGPINTMEILKDKMYFWQTRAFGILQINPRAIITDVGNIGNSELEIGTGLALQRHDYLSTELGLQHQWGLTKSNHKLFWLDVNNRKFFSFGGENIEFNSDAKGLFSYLSNNLKYNILTTDKPVYNDISTDAIGINGVRAVYDFKYNQAIFTVHDSRNTGVNQSATTPFTLAFDERLNTFTSFYTFYPKVYFTDGYRIFSTNYGGLSDIYMHDSGEYCDFYGTTYPHSIKFVVNDGMQHTKVFDNLMYDSQSLDVSTGINYNDDTWNTIRVYDNYQNSDYQTLSPGVNIKRKERTWQLAVPRNRVLYTSSNSPDIFTDLSPTDKVMGERMRDKFIVIQLFYNNSLNRELAFNNLRTLFRPSVR